MEKKGRKKKHRIKIRRHKTVLRFLQMEFEDMERDFDIKTIGVVDKNTGEWVELCDIMPIDAEEFIKDVFRKYKLSFFVLFKDVFANALNELTPMGFRLLCHLMTDMNNWKTISGFTRKELAERYKMSAKSLARSFRELEKEGYIVIYSKKGKMLYRIIPTLCWKGSPHRIPNTSSAFLNFDD